jgi:hypothetical protein
MIELTSERNGGDGTKTVKGNKSEIGRDLMFDDTRLYSGVRCPF